MYVEKAGFLRAKEEEFLQEDCSDDEPLAKAVGRGHRQPKRKVFLAESSESSEDEEKAGPSKTAHKAKKVYLSW